MKGKFLLEFVSFFRVDAFVKIKNKLLPLLKE